MVNGVRNPSEGTTSTGWSIKSLINTDIIDQSLNFYSFDYEEPFTPSYIFFEGITPVPSNADVTATYTFEIKTIRSLPKATIIDITFPPSNYKSLPINPQCKVSGSIKYLESCILTGTTIRAVTAEKQIPGNIFIQVDGIDNPDEGLTETFEIKTTYDSLDLDLTDTSVNASRVISITSSPNQINDLSLIYDPQNEGEEAMYQFEFFPSSTIEEAVTEIVIIFPLVYDKNLGYSVQCEVVSGLLGYVQCRVSESKIYISGFDTYIPN